jgi:hypothetical protein
MRTLEAGRFPWSRTSTDRPRVPHSAAQKSPAAPAPMMMMSLLMGSGCTLHVPISDGWNTAELPEQERSILCAAEGAEDGERISALFARRFPESSARGPRTCSLRQTAGYPDVPSPVRLCDGKLVRDGRANATEEEMPAQEAGEPHNGSLSSGSPVSVELRGVLRSPDDPPFHQYHLFCGSLTAFMVR